VELRALAVLHGELAQRVQLGLDRLPQPGPVLALVLLERLDVGVERVAPRREIRTSLSSRERSFSATRRAVPSASVTRFRALASDSSSNVRARPCASAIASSAVFCASTSVRWSISSVSRLLPVLPSTDWRRSVN
jgi:hypothetical protein